MPFLALQDAAVPFAQISASNDILGAWMICFFTLAVYSFLYRDNPFYKTAEHVFVGAGTAYFALQYYEEGILGGLRDHIERALEASANGTAIELGGFGVDPFWAIVFRCIALVLALMLLSRLFLPNSWAARWPLAIMVGIYAALKMTGETQSKFVLMLKGAIKPWTTTDGPALTWSEYLASDVARIEQTAIWQNFAYVILLVGMTCALLHFVFTFQRSKSLGAASRVGVVTLMITFGSMFGFTVLGRYALLIERLDTMALFTSGPYSLTGGSDTAANVLSPPWILAGIIIVGVLVHRMRSPAEGEN